MLTRGSRGSVYLQGVRRRPVRDVQGDGLTADSKDVGKKSSPRSGKVLQFRVYVKRGAQRRFEQLEREAEGLPVVVQWDRRVADRRNDSETPGAELVGLRPRTGERRTPSSFNFPNADFVVVEEQQDDEQE